MSLALPCNSNEPRRFKRFEQKCPMSALQYQLLCMLNVKVGQPMSRGWSCVKTQGLRHWRVIVFHDKAAEMTAGDHSYVTLTGNDSRIRCAVKWRASLPNSLAERGRKKSAWMTLCTDITLPKDHTRLIPSAEKRRWRNKRSRVHDDTELPPTLHALYALSMNSFSWRETQETWSHPRLTNSAKW